MTKDGEIKMATSTKEPSANGQTPPSAKASDDSEASTQASTSTPSVLPTLRFSRDQYHAKTRVRVAIQRMGECVGEVKVEFVAKEEELAAGKYLEKREVIFLNGQSSQTISMGVRPNFSEEPIKINLELLNPINAQLGDPHDAVVLVQPLTGMGDYLRSKGRSIVTNPNVGRVVKHILLGLVLTGSIFLLDFFVASYADSHKKEWDVYLNPINKPELVFLEDAPITIKEHEQKRLRDQLSQIRNKEDLHRELMEFYYKGYYMGIIILCFAAALAAITLVIITKRGWAATNEYLITTFFIMTCVSLFYGSWAGLFKQEDNITNNKVLYLKYRALENELFSYVTTGEALNYNYTSLIEVKPIATPAPTPVSSQSSTRTKAKSAKTTATPTSDEKPYKPEHAEDSTQIGIKLDAADFIHHVDLQLAQDNIAIGFDYSQIPNYKNAFSNVSTKN